MSTSKKRKPATYKRSAGYNRPQNRRKVPHKKQVSRKKKLKQHSRTIALLFVIVVIVLAIVISASVSHKRKKVALNEDAIEVSQSVIAYEDLIDQYAAKYGIKDYKEYLLAIMEVESGGFGSSDVMQSSESAGLPVNTLGEEASVEQGCAHFAECLEEARAQECDLKTAIQAYNYGKGFISYVAENGGAYSLDLAESFAREQSGGVTKEYNAEIAIETNGGWRYAYGNMFYVPLVEQYIKIIRELE